MRPFQLLPRAYLVAPLLALLGSGAWAGGPESAAAAAPPGQGQGSFDPVAYREAGRPPYPFKVPSPLSSATDLAQGGVAIHSQTPIGPSCSLADRPAQVLAQINAVRTSGHTCGGQPLGSAAALAWNERLFSAASGHSADMARRDYLDHVTPEGVEATHRMGAAGYGWSRVGENIAGGNSSVEAVMKDWLRSDDHCRNILNPAFTEVAVACVRSTGSRFGTYWTMVLGRAERVASQSPVSAFTTARAAAAVAGPRRP